MLLLFLVSGLGDSVSMMMTPSGAGGSGAGPSGEGPSGTKLPAHEDSRGQQPGVEPQIFEGIPVPIAKIEEAIASPFYISSVIHIPGEIEDPYIN